MGPESTWARMFSTSPFADACWACFLSTTCAGGLFLFWNEPIFLWGVALIEKKILNNFQLQRTIGLLAH
jgi:hypothetical protein